MFAPNPCPAIRFAVVQMQDSKFASVSAPRFRGHRKVNSRKSKYLRIFIHCLPNVNNCRHLITMAVTMGKRKDPGVWDDVPQKSVRAENLARSSGRLLHRGLPTTTNFFTLPKNITLIPMRLKTNTKKEMKSKSLIKTQFQQIHPIHPSLLARSTPQK